VTVIFYTDKKDLIEASGSFSILVSRQIRTGCRYRRPQQPSMRALMIATLTWQGSGLLLAY
jgi:hypothetical protein